MKALFLAILIALIYFPSVNKIHAYLDPGSGSFILQIFFGLILGAGVAIKMYWRKIKIYLSKFISQKK